MQIVAYALAVVALALVFTHGTYSGRVMSATLGVFWIWMGAVYHIMHFRQINPAALVFGIVFVAEGALFLYYGVIKSRISLSYVNRPIPQVGLLFVCFAMVIYPLIGAAFGHRYPAAPLFGVAPCPTTIFTMGVLLWSDSSIPALLLPVPFLWSLVGMSAAVSLRVPQDYGLVVAGAGGTVLLLLQNRRRALLNQALQPTVTLALRPSEGTCKDEGERASPDRQASPRLDATLGPRQ